jgi:hypothetical protein
VQTPSLESNLKLMRNTVDVASFGGDVEESE